ncbi:ABC transporter substrate-binding protein, partial [Arcobacteraceae bacterium]|nr:ABC transporter substrate-binding protein [Arcobacteraceae bacterium]
MKKIVLVLMFCISFIHAEDLEKVSLQLKWKHQFQFAGFIAAYEKGFYKDLGMDVEFKEISEDLDVVDSVLSGKSDFAISDSSLIYAALKEKPVTALMAVFQDSAYMLMGLKEKNIQKLEDLKGKKIALYEGTFGISIKAMLKTKNIDYFAKPPIYDMEQLLSSDVEMMSAYVSNEPYMAKQSKLDIVTFKPKDYGFEGYGDILFTATSMIKNNPELVKKFYEASEKGWKYAFSHIDELVNIIYDKYNTLNKSKNA